MPSEFDPVGDEAAHEPIRQPADTAPERSAARVLPRLLVLLATVAALVAMPRLLETVQYSLTRGRLRAQAEVAEAHLVKYNKIADPADAFKWIALRMEPCVVHINTQRRAEFARMRDERSFLFGDPDTYQISGEGSGVIVDSAGYIVTNHHVIDGADKVEVILGDERVVSPENVTVVGADPLTDVAVLKINAPGLVAAQWGESDALEVGDWVVAVGNPFGLDRTVTAGILSAKRKKFVDRAASQDYLQTDVAVNPGNSGGPLVNLKGEVVGINTAIVGNSYQGISFAVPSDIAKNVYEQIKSNGRAVRGWLGVNMEKITADTAADAGLPRPEGALVTGVVVGSPADKARLQTGDIIVDWGGKPIANPRELSLAVAGTEIDATAAVGVVRGQDRLSVSVTVSDWPTGQIRMKR